MAKLIEFFVLNPVLSDLAILCSLELQVGNGEFEVIRRQGFASN